MKNEAIINQKMEAELSMDELDMVTGGSIIGDMIDIIINPWTPILNYLNS